MKKSRYTEEQIAYALRLAESEEVVAAVCRQMGVAAETPPAEPVLISDRHLIDKCGRHHTWGIDS
ncbi:transposase [Dyella terrae]|uniref:transposase n=1 Tax=Dyella terrae TaxID=522259 RepID=UPI003D189521|nr:Transposase protein [Dyella terrae]